MLIKRHNTKGFTLVEVLVVVVILAILAAIAVPIYLRYVNSARAGEAQEAIGAIWAAAKVYHSQTGHWPSDVNLLTNLKLDPSVKSKWDFTMTAGGTGIQKINATSKGPMPGGAGKNVWLICADVTWHGYGIDTD